MSLNRQDATRKDEMDNAPKPPLQNLPQFSSSAPSPVKVGLTPGRVFPTMRQLTVCQETINDQTPPLVRGVRNKLAEPVLAAFLAGGVAGAVSRTLVSPLERLKILLQIQSTGREEYKLSIWRALVKMGREEGWRGFMRGNGTNCIRIIPYSAVQFGSYNFYKKVGGNCLSFICVSIATLFRGRS